MQISLRFAAKAALLAMVAVLVAGLGFAQTSNGTIAGVVTDATGAAITDAKVTATSNNTGEVRTSKTNGLGAYRFESVLPGTYSITVNADGFNAFTLANVNVAASVVTSANAMLKIGQATEAITVEAGPATLQTESAEVSHTISTNDVAQLPVASLNAYSLATTLPGVVTSQSAEKFTNGTEFAVNGTRPRANNFLIEGQDNNDAGIRGQGIQPQNLDAVKEVSVQTNSYAPEFGNSGGSVNNIIFKSGTNNFHGALWDRLSNSSLDANDHANNINDIAKTVYRENVFGFDIGGPIKKDKLFFFVSHQWDRYNSTQGGNGAAPIIIPTANGIATLQGLLATANPTQTAQINKLLSAYGSLRGQSATPQTSLLQLGDGRGVVEVGPANRIIPNNQKNAEFIAKGDYLLSSKDTINLRYLRSGNTAPFDIQNFPTQLPGFDTQQSGAAHNAGVTYTRVINNNMINELRASYGRIGFGFDLRPETLANPLGLSAVNISNMTGWGAPTGVPQGRFHNTYQLQDSLSWVKGNHSFKYGFDLADIRVRDGVPFNFFGSTSYAVGGSDATGTPYSALANYIDNFGGRSSQTTITFGNPVIHPAMFQQAYFFQDAWKLRQNLTFTYGMRYEFSGTPANVLAFPAVDPQNMNATTLLSRIEQKSDKNNFAPRLGLAYTPNFWHGLFGDNKTVIRAGFGMFYDVLFTNILDNTASSSPNVSSPVATSRVNALNPRGTANWSSVLASMQPVAPSPSNLFEPIANNLRNPEIYQWNFSVQRELPSKFTLTTSYIGTRGAHLLANNEANAFLPSGARRLSDVSGRVILRDNEGDSIYHGLDVDLNRKFTNGFELRTAYTFSKLIDNGSEIFTGSDSFTSYSSFPVVQFPVNRGTFDRGLSAFDRRHRLAITYIYDVPKFAMSKDNFFGGVISNVVNGWQFAGTTAFQSGAPGNVLIGADWNGDGITNDRPSLGNPNAPITTWAFTDPSSSTGFCEGTAFAFTNDPCHPVSAKDVRYIVGDFGTNGNLGRNSYTAAWTQDWTFAVSKNFKVTERQSFQFRTEMLNPFNHGNTSVPTLSLIGGHLQTPFTFGDQSITSAGNRQIRFLLKYSF